MLEIRGIGKVVVDSSTSKRGAAGGYGPNPAFRLGAATPHILGLGGVEGSDMRLSLLKGLNSIVKNISTLRIPPSLQQKAVLSACTDQQHETRTAWLNGVTVLLILL